MPEAAASLWVEYNEQTDQELKMRRKKWQKVLLAM